MPSPLQPELLFAPAAEPTDGDILRQYLESAGGAWRTRVEITRALGWTDRQVRGAAEQLGSDVVRGQWGFKLTHLLQRDEISIGVQAADAFAAQGKRMIRQGLALRRRLHSLVG